MAHTVCIVRRSEYRWIARIYVVASYLLVSNRLCEWTLFERDIHVFETLALIGDEYFSVTKKQNCKTVKNEIRKTSKQGSVYQLILEMPLDILHGLQKPYGIYQLRNHKITYYFADIVARNLPLSRH